MISENLKKSKKEWKEYEVELDNQIEEIKEKNDFKDSELNVREINGRAKLLDKDDARNLIKKPAKEIEINKRLVITKTVMNDTRRVKPRNESEEKGKIKIFKNSAIDCYFARVRIRWLGFINFVKKTKNQRRNRRKNEEKKLNRRESEDINLHQIQRVKNMLNDQNQRWLKMLGGLLQKIRVLIKIKSQNKKLKWINLDDESLLNRQSLI